jgi:hypothetical protein
MPASDRSRRADALRDDTFESQTAGRGERFTFWACVALAIEIVLVVTGIK